MLVGIVCAGYNRVQCVVVYVCRLQLCTVCCCVCVQGTIVYSVVGVPPAPTFFSVNSITGSVTVRGNLKTDLSMSYVVSTTLGPSATAFTVAMLRVCGKLMRKTSCQMSSLL